MMNLPKVTPAELLELPISELSEEEIYTCHITP
jgi:hypothetical protein